MAVKLYISQPMRGKAMNDIMAERKQLVAEAAVELRTDDILVLDTLFINHDRPKLAMLGRPGLEAGRGLPGRAHRGL